MNWEAVAVIGGGAILLLLVLAPLAVWLSRLRSDPNRPPEASLTVTGALVIGGMVLAMIFGMVFREGLLLDVPEWSRSILTGAYLVGVVLLALGVGAALQRLGYPFSRPPLGRSPPNKSLRSSPSSTE